MSASSMPRWVLNVRSFVATDKLPFLSEAIDTCNDPEIRKFLHSLLIHGELDANEAQPVLARLMTQDRKPEAMMLVILGLRKAALALWNANHLDREHEKVAHASCLQLMSLGRDLGFPECEARSALTLGTYYASRRERGKTDRTDFLYQP